MRNCFYNMKICQIFISFLSRSKNQLDRVFLFIIIIIKIDYYDQCFFYSLLAGAAHKICIGKYVTEVTAILYILTHKKGITTLHTFFYKNTLYKNVQHTFSRKVVRISLKYFILIYFSHLSFLVIS